MTTPSVPTEEIVDLSPFKRMIMTIGTLPTAFTESMTYYEALAYFVKYLEETVIPAVNQNAKATEELQELFIQLKEYVDNYFASLDVQEEINNKLDEMAESGELAEIISLYLNSNAIMAYDTIADMESATNLVDGSFAKTYGKLTYNDGDGRFYKIREILNTDVIDGFTKVALHDPTLVAEMMYDNQIIELNEDIDTKLDKERGDAERLGVGNETYTSPSAWTSTVESVRANRASTQPTLPNAPSVFSPHDGREASLYTGRDSVAIFIANQGRNPYLTVSESTTYSSTSVTYPNGSDLSKIKVGMVIDTTGSVAYSGIIEEIDTVNQIFVVDGWYHEGTQGQPTNGDGYVVGNIVKLWGKNTTVTLNPSFPQRLAVGEEMGLYNNLPAGTNKTIIGYDCVTLGSGVGDIGYLARSGDEVFDSEPAGKLNSGFVASKVVEGFETRNDNLDNFLILSKNSNNLLTKNNFYITNGGMMTNPKHPSANISADGQIPNPEVKYWTFIPNADLTYNLPDLTSSTYTAYNNREYVFLNRSSHTITLGNNRTIAPYTSKTFYAKNVWIEV